MARSVARRFTLALLLGGALALPSSAAAVTLTPAPPADARCETTSTGTICFWSDTFGPPIPLPYGPTCGGLPVLFFFTGDRSWTTWYDENGTLVRRVRHASYEGTLSIAATGASVPHAGHFTLHEDFLAGTSTVTGLVSRSVVVGDGVIWRHVGRRVVSLATGAPLSQAGDFDLFALLAGDPTVAAELCAALS